MISLNLSNQRTLNVDTFEDQNDGSQRNGLSLRDAIIIANRDLQNQYTINLPQGTYKLTLDGALPIAGDIIIKGNNSNGQKTIIDGSGIRDNVFSVGFGQSLLILDSLTITNSPQAGIRVFSPSAKVNLLNSEISNNQAGGIINQGKMSIDNSLIINNFSREKAGGIQNIGTGMMVITNSTISKNTSEIGAGGIINDYIEDELPGAGTLTIINTTISENISIGGNGGGVLARRIVTEEGASADPVTTTIINSTIINNTAINGSGIYSEEVGLFNNRLVIQNTIVAQNIVPTEKLESKEVDYPLFTLSQTPPVNFIEQFVWDLVDGTNRLIQPPSDVNPFRQSFYEVRVVYKNEDPFSSSPPEGLDFTGKVNLSNIIFNADADVAFVFSNYDGISVDGFFSEANGFISDDGNLISNQAQDFQFAYRDALDNLVFLDTEFEFDAQGKLTLVLSSPSISNDVSADTPIFLVDRQGILPFDSFNNNIILDDTNKRQAPFVRGQNNKFLNFVDVAGTDTRTVTESVPITDIPLPNDIYGFFSDNSRFNFVGASDTRAGGILNNQNNNIVGNSTDPLNPQLLEYTNNNGQIGYVPLNSSPAVNAGNNTILQTQPFFTANPIDQFGNPRINGNNVDIGSVESGFIDVQSVLTETDSLLNTPVIRFQNRDVLGTYLYATGAEAQQIRSNYPNFSQEGQAFKVANQQADGLIKINRFQNTAVPGTYLFVTEEESISIRQNYRNFKEEGTAFYVYDANAGIGEDVYRFQSVNLPGTYLFVLEAEKNNIVANFSNQFRFEGVAFEVAI